MAPNKHDQIKTAVACFVFNRPDLTEQLLAAIEVVRPKKLFVIADGPRKDHSSDERNCEAVQSLFNNLQWECEVTRHFSAANLGCKRRISSGLDWVFSQVDEAIILEDDTVPDVSFFPYCETLLERYRDDESVFIIRGHGSNLSNLKNQPKGDYYLSQWPAVWGWASWSRAWKHYDVDMTSWPELRDRKWLQQHFANSEQAKVMSYFFDEMHAGRIDSWEFQLFFACWVRGAYAIAPMKNLVTNIGFDARGTHFQDPKNPHSKRDREPLELPLEHPDPLLPWHAADHHEWNENYTSTKKQLTKWYKLKKALKRLIK